MNVYERAWRPEVNLAIALQEYHPPFLSVTGFSHGVPASPITLEQLANEPWSSACLHLPGDWIKGMSQHTQLFFFLMWVLGSIIRFPCLHVSNLQTQGMTLDSPL